MKSTEIEQEAHDHQDGMTEQPGGKPTVEQLRVSRRKAMQIPVLSALGIAIGGGVGLFAARRGDDSPILKRGGLYGEQFDNERKIKELERRNREIDIKLEDLESPGTRRLGMRVQLSDIDEKIKELQLRRRNIVNFLEDGEE